MSGTTSADELLDFVEQPKATKVVPIKRGDKEMSITVRGLSGHHAGTFYHLLSKTGMDTDSDELSDNQLAEIFASFAHKTKVNQHPFIYAMRHGFKTPVLQNKQVERFYLGLEADEALALVSAITDCTGVGLDDEEEAKDKDAPEEDLGKG